MNNSKHLLTYELGLSDTCQIPLAKVTEINGSTNGRINGSSESEDCNSDTEDLKLLTRFCLYNTIDKFNNFCFSELERKFTFTL